MALGFAAAYAVKHQTVDKVPEVKLSHFLTALSCDMIQEVIVDGLQVFFRNKDSWFSTNVSFLSKDRLYKLFRKKTKMQCLENAEVSLD